MDSTSKRPPALGSSRNRKGKRTFFEPDPVNLSNQVSVKYMRKNLEKPFLWLFGLFLCLPVSVYGALYQVDQVSEPAGFLLQSSAVEEGSSFLSLNPALVSSGYTFGYWSINGVRQTAPDGRSLTRVSSVINATSTYKAHYFLSSLECRYSTIGDFRNLIDVSV